MKTSLNWLSEFLPGEKLVATQVADALTAGGLPVESMETSGDDTVIDVEVTSNRADCLCHIGVARELAALRNRPFKTAVIDAQEAAEAASDAIGVAIEAGELCPHYTARVIRGVKIGPSPAWLVKRLEAVGVRPINNVVDVTNYVLFEMGQPLHAFDLGKINGAKIIVREAAKGETLVSIDGRTRALSPGMLVIADGRGPVALAGIMGGKESEVTTATADVLLESARFDPLCVRRTARALAMKSDSSYRFERGIDPTLPMRASLRAAQLILQTGGGKLLRGVVQAGSPGYSQKMLSLRLSRMKQILGVELPVGDVVAALDRLGLKPVQHGERIDVTAPSHRLDISQEIDLVEEAARVLGYDRIPTREEISIRLTPPDAEAGPMDVICQTLVARGYFEAVTFSFVSDLLKTDFGASNLRAEPAVKPADAYLRPSLIPGLLEALRFNKANGNASPRLFEIGNTFHAGEKGVSEKRNIAWVRDGEFGDAAGVAQALLGRLDADRAVRMEPAGQAGFAAGACAKVLWGGEAIGFVGRIDKTVAQKLSMRETPVAAELDLAALVKGCRRIRKLKELPRFPAVRRDLSLIVSESVRYEEIEKLIQGLKLADLETIEFVTTYRGKPLEKGKKSVTVTLVFRSSAATLTSEQVEASVQRAIAAAGEKLGAVLRT